MERSERVLAYLVFAIFMASNNCAEGQAVLQRGSAAKANAPISSQAGNEPVEIAKGSYTIFREYGGIGPVDSEVFNFHEDWALSRTADGNYQVEGIRNFESPKDYPRQIRFFLKLSPKLQLIEAQEDTSLVWIPHSAPLTCVFLPKQLQCSTNGKDPRKNPDQSLAMDDPYAFSWPLSAFSLAALTRQSDHELGKSTAIQFVDFEQPSNDLPLLPITTNGTLRFLGQEKVDVAGQVWDADKFQMQAFMSELPRKSVLWVSKGGLLLRLDAEREIGPSGRLELTHFEQTSASPLFP